MAKGKSPTARSLERLRADGFIVEVVEKTIPRCFIKKDFIGCIDLIAFRKGEIIGIQATSGSNHAARRTKSLDVLELNSWIEAGAHFEIWSWSKPKTGRSWDLRRERLTPEQISKAHFELRMKLTAEEVAEWPEWKRNFLSSLGAANS